MLTNPFRCHLPSLTQMLWWFSICGLRMFQKHLIVVDERENGEVWQWMRWTARYFQLLKRTSNPILRSNRIVRCTKGAFVQHFHGSSLLLFCATERPDIGVQCMIAKYLIIRFQVNASINYWILLPELPRFYDSISFSIIHLLFGIN